MIVYKVTNQINNKIYVGITTKSMEERFKLHSTFNRKGLGQAITKYGAENFIIEQIDTADTHEELTQKEIDWIAKLTPQYNLTKGGDGTIGYKHSDDFREYRKTVMQGNTYHAMPHTEESKKLISKKLKGNTNKKGKTGAKLSDAFKERRREIMLENNPAKDINIRKVLSKKALIKHPCPHCGKTMNAGNLSRHVKICEKI